MRRKRSLAIALVLSGIVAALFLVGLRNSRADPVFRHAAIGLPDWPAGAAPVRVALVADLHLGNLSTDTVRLRRVVAAIDARHPDLVVIAGDILAGYDADTAAARAGQAAAALAGLRAPLGIYAVLGNHDNERGPAVQAALRRVGIFATDNTAVRVGPIGLGLSGDTTSGTAKLGKTFVKLDRLARQAPIARVYVTHSPDLVKFLREPHTLLLAGHTHCGQVVLPLIGPLIRVSNLYGNRYRCGLIREPGRIVVVTAGIGTSNLPIRFGAPPDVWILTLGPTKGTAAPPRR